MAEELRHVPINKETVSIASFALWFREELLDKELILDKNEQYGDSWQAEGPFLAASRMKDKITRVEALIQISVGSDHFNHHVVGASLETRPEGFQDILEMIAYGKMLMLYWVHNGFALETNLESVREVYHSLEKELRKLDVEDNNVPDATG